MWIRKSQLEIDQEKNQPKLPDFLGCFILILIGTVIYERIGGISWIGSSFPPMTWQQIFGQWPFLIGISVLIAFGQVFIKDKKTFVCLKCGETSQKSGDICECGGLRIDQNEAKWVDDPSDEGYEPAECVKCGAPISDKESKCPKCGWTWIVSGENVPDIEKRFFTDK